MAMPMPAPQNAEHPTDRRQHRGLGQELEQDLLAASAKRFADADLPRPLGDRNHHDRHHANTTDHQRDR